MKDMGFRLLDMLFVGAWWTCIRCRVPGGLIGVMRIFVGLSRLSSVGLRCLLVVAMTTVLKGVLLG